MITHQNMPRGVKIAAGIALAASAVVAQGYAMFCWNSTGAHFISISGLKCTVIPAIIELVIGGIAASKLDELLASMVSNPHSRIGHALRNPVEHRPLPPPTRAAWNGAWESPESTAERMGVDR